MEENLCLSNNWVKVQIDTYHIYIYLYTQTHTHYNENVNVIKSMSLISLKVTSAAVKDCDYLLIQKGSLIYTVRLNAEIKIMFNSHNSSVIPLMIYSV